jgi:7-cyano-7-deazaguanine synthase
MKHAVLSLSGGMDSSTLLLHLLAEGYSVTCLSFDYGQKHNLELKRAQELIKYLQDNKMDVIHQTIELKGLAPLLNSTLVTGGDDVPEGHYEQSNMVLSVVPNRNKIFSSIIQAVALSIANKEQDDVIIAMGIHAGDHEIYKDCRQEFRDIDHQAFLAGNWDSHRVSMYTPYLHTDKFGILKDGENCCLKLNLDFNEVYKRTNTSYKPLQVTISYNNDVNSTEWVSDYKSASSVERVEAFIKLGRPDPVSYGDEFGVASWDVVVNHVQNVLNNHKK